MPTIITHALVGTGFSAAWPSNKIPRRFWVLSILLPMLPDADVISFAFGLPYDHVLGHRGFFHSLPFAVLLGLAAVVLAFRSTPFLTRRWFGLAAYFSALVASHGLLDALTNGGEGVALLAPFDNTRYFFGFRPIQVSPIGLRSFLSEWGLRTLVSEALWIWLPGLVLVTGIKTWQLFRRRSQ